MSITKVAHLAGVSKSTVSRVINQSAKVAPEVVKAVQSAMAKIGYQPPLRRRGPKPLSRRGIRTGNIALLAMGMPAADFYRMPVFPSLLHGVERALAEQGLNLILANLGQSEGLPAVLATGQADGVLLWGRWDAMPDSIRARLREIPIVWIGREHSDDEGEFDHVFYNNAAVGPLACRYLLHRGHRRLAFVDVVPEHTAFAQRHRDFVAAARKAQLEVAVAAVDRSGRAGTFSSYLALVDQFTQKRATPTGMFVPTDALLPELYHALRERDITPGHDLDIVSCDNEEQFLSRLSPRPATIDINLDLVGRRGVQQLLWRMRHPEQKNRISVLIEPTLVEPARSGPQGRNGAENGMRSSGNSPNGDAAQRESRTSEYWNDSG